MKYICSWSGGKDSTASIILAHEHNLPLDMIVFSEVMFDKKKGISGENVRHIQFMKEIAKPLFESWGYEVKILRAEKDYLDVFNSIIEKPRLHMEHKGMKYGFAISGLCSVKRECKIKPMQDFYKTIDEPITQYVGIAVDEPDRLESMHKDTYKISLLEEFGYTESMAMEKCLEYGLLSPSYELTKRNGCWFCPNAKLCEHREIRKTNPEAWYQFLEMEKDTNIAHDKWNAYKKETLAQREEMFKWEDAQLSIFDFI